MDDIGTHPNYDGGAVPIPIIAPRPSSIPARALSFPHTRLPPVGADPAIADALRALHTAGAHFVTVRQQQSAIQQGLGAAPSGPGRRPAARGAAGWWASCPAASAPWWSTWTRTTIRRRCPSRHRRRRRPRRALERGGRRGACQRTGAAARRTRPAERHPARWWRSLGGTGRLMARCATGSGSMATYEAPTVS